MKSIVVVLLSLISLALVACDDSVSTSTDTPVISTEVPAPISTSLREDRVYVDTSNVPDPVYQIDAVEAFKEAKALHPVDGIALLKTFSELFNAKHKVSGGWKVAEKYDYFYNPNINYVYVALGVIDANGDRLVLIFN
ncbi:uncharacterized protein LOC126879828 [Diabrotica virgifera virgifera]|uniref:Uncharacterized protein n=1 Tax=Diabrotica virgifera virgifera TaxID=50390 RepID=A0ABM5JMA9_DIAVI|nr:uncharacterized protein LOC126879828 [Diabrotica virgifera virgifera]